VLGREPGPLIVLKNAKNVGKRARVPNFVEKAE
jgi:hypothetical protein